MKLTKLDNNRYTFNDGFIEIEGDWEFIFNQMKDTFQIPVSELQMAVNWMSQANHNTCHFGVLGRVTHTSNASFVSACINELDAVLAAQQRFHEAYTKDRNSKATHNAADNLKVLWVALNIDGIKALLEDKYEVRALKKTS